MTQEQAIPKDRNDRLIAIRIPESMLGKIDDLAMSEGRSRSSQIRHIVDAYAYTFAGPVSSDVDPLSHSQLHR